ncbi:MAG: phosphatidylserine/phosphatidylglycerophosphate/cardiolipin synthase family protein [Verrucomicrobiota bacterium]|nr:phosphatidylserine/phosphatidylglycerophosphate/cardiolipin synthase family protein [Verrucomicrobiota bacterium]
MPDSFKQFCWLRTGAQALTEMLDAINSAQISIRFEMYIFHASPIADQFRHALAEAVQRGVRVQVLLDALGSISLPESAWDLFKKRGGEFRWFNPLHFKRLIFRDHRKMLVCDDQVAFVGGFNVASVYFGDGVQSGWRDLGMKISGPLVKELSAAFDEMFSLADFQHKPFSRLRKSAQKKIVSLAGGKLLLSAPGRQRSPIKISLRQDLEKARRIEIISAYFLPTWKIRRDLIRVARRGGTVQLILAGKSDVPLMQLAARSLYRRLLKAGVEIYEYQPQILHAKLIVIDDAVYVGSSNLDVRSLHINYELLARLENEKVAGEAREIFENDLTHCKRIQFEEWNNSRSFWIKIKSHWAYFILAKLDPYLAGIQLKFLRAPKQT